MSLYYKYLPQLFPQHANGRKHTRRIVLEAWQRRIVEAYPLEFWRGLYHSDGSRFSNVVNGKDYPRYQFLNVSEDIITLFCETYDRLGLRWTTKTRRTAAGVYTSDVFISRCPGVEYLDRMVGPKS